MESSEVKGNQDITMHEEVKTADSKPSKDNDTVKNSTVGSRTMATTNISHRKSPASRYQKSPKQKRQTNDTFLRKRTLLNNDSSMLAIAEDQYLTPGASIQKISPAPIQKLRLNTINTINMMPKHSSIVESDSLDIRSKAMESVNESHKTETYASPDSTLNKYH